jgi:4-amino-4-deoxy-L-arabinose transferase-like glycosyltransferase
LIGITTHGLFIGDESNYISSIYSLTQGRLDTLNHPLLAKTIWYVFVDSNFLITGGDNYFYWRIGTILFSLGSLIVFYRISRLFFSNYIALFGVVLLAIDPMFFSLSRIVMPDIPMIFFFLLSFYYILRFQERRENVFFYCSGIMLGLCLATKLSPLIIIAPLSILISSLVLRKEKKTYYLRIVLLYIISFGIGYLFGNLIFFTKKSDYNFFTYTIALVQSQLSLPINPSGYLTSPPWSWFTIPQILTLFRVLHKNTVETVVGFENPVLFLLTIPTIIISTVLLVRKKLKNKILVVTTLLFFIVIYLTFFLPLHATYYYYILPLIPLTILLLLEVVTHFKKYTVALSVCILLVSIGVFVFYYPLLIGKEVSRKYENTLFSYSQFHFPDKSSVFCQLCSPHK